MDVEGENDHEQVEYKEFWWEGVNLHLKTVDDRHIVFMNCVVHTTHYTVEDSSGIIHDELVKEFRAKGKMEIVN